MVTKEQALNSILHECGVAKHLYAKIPAAKMDWRPAENMRTTLDLLRYLSYCGLGPATGIVRGNWELAKDFRVKAEKMQAHEFPRAMDAQARSLESLFADLLPEDFEREVRFPWGAQAKLGEGLINTTLKFLTAYRMQLFLYAKIAGVKDLSTMNCWMGMDTPPGGMPQRG